MVRVPLGPAGPPPALELEAQAAASRLTAMTTPSLIRRLIALALRLVLCARQGVSASASRAGAGRLAGQVSGHLAGFCRRSCQNHHEHLETYPGRDLHYVIIVSFVILAFLVFLVKLVTADSIRHGNVAGQGADGLRGIGADPPGARSRGATLSCPAMTLLFVTMSVTLSWRLLGHYPNYRRRNRVRGRTVIWHMSPARQDRDRCSDATIMRAGRLNVGDDLVRHGLPRACVRAAAQ